MSYVIDRFFSMPGCEHAVLPAAPGLLRVQLTKEGKTAKSRRFTVGGLGLEGYG